MIKKSKDAFVYDFQGNKYYDLRKNTNIIGYSNKNLTNAVKGYIPSKWNLTGDTIYHRRIKSLFIKLFKADYFPAAVFSLTEVISRLINYSSEKEYNLKFYGVRFNSWLNENFYNLKIFNNIK